MRLFKSLALLSALLLVNSVMPASSSLAAYSETRSFRDALDGRSMEEAISGPVDKDTSSYGDRTANSGASNSNTNGANSASGSPMMLSIPANGNLNNMGQQQTMTGGVEEQQQQTSSPAGDSELEREAGPIGTMTSMDGQQQMMEQRAARQRNPTGRMMPSMARMTSQRNGRQQQQQQTEAEYPVTKSGDSPGFGDEQSKKGYGQDAKSSQMPEQQTEQSVKSTGNGNYAPSGDDQQQTTTTGEQDQQQEKGYSSGMDEQQMLAKQKAMAAMLMSMSSPDSNANSNYMRSSMASGNKENKSQKYNDKKMMDANMMMSPVNKPTYANQKMSQRQMAPPMMIANGYSQGTQSNGNGMSGNYQSAGMANNSPSYGSMSMMSGNQRGMRRANQRGSERKMSPAMVNAMLNKMLNSKDQYSTSQTDSMPNSVGGYSNPSAAGAMNDYNSMGDMMKSSMKAEMLANMMMSSKAASAMAQMEPARREKYKKMMMAAIMQQTQGSDYSSANGQEQQMEMEPQQQGAGYGSEKSPRTTGSSNGYGMGSAMPPMSMLVNMMAKQLPMGQSYGMSMEQRPMNSGYGGRSPSKGYSNAENQQQKMDESPMMMPMMSQGKYKSDGQQDQQQMQMPNQMSTRMMMMRNKMPSYGSQGMSMMKMQMGGKSPYGMSGFPVTTQSSYGGEMEQQKEMTPTTMPSATKGQGESQYGARDSMSSTMSPMNGFRQSYNPEQQEDIKGSTSKGQDSYSSQSPMPMNGQTKGSSPGEYSSPSKMPRPMQMQQDSYGQQQQQETDEQTQQQQDYGQAPMGQAEPFAFDYKIDDNYGNNQYRKEESDKNGVVRGSYGYMDQSGIYRHVEYVADENGFRANIKSNEPGLSTEPVVGKTSTNGESGSNSATQMPTQMMMDGVDSQAQSQMPMDSSSNQSMGTQQQVYPTGSQSKTNESSEK